MLNKNRTKSSCWCCGEKVEKRDNFIRFPARLNNRLCATKRFIFARTSLTSDRTETAAVRSSRITLQFEVKTNVLSNCRNAPAFCTVHSDVVVQVTIFNITDRCFQSLASEK